MSKLVFSAVVLLAGLAIHGALRRRADTLPLGLRTFAPRILGEPDGEVPLDVRLDRRTPHYGIELKEASLANIRFDQNYEKAIEAKQIEEQKAEQKRYELIQAQRQAEIIAAAAKGRGDAAREEAKGVAEATRIKGDAEAAYNARVSSSLTQTLIQQQYLSKWDGRLLQYTFGGSSVPFVQLPTAGGGAGDGTRR